MCTKNKRIMTSVSSKDIKYISLASFRSNIHLMMNESKRKRSWKNYYERCMVCSFLSTLPPDLASPWSQSYKVSLFLQRAFSFSLLFDAHTLTGKSKKRCFRFLERVFGEWWCLIDDCFVLRNENSSSHRQSQRVEKAACFRVWVF